MEVFEAHTVWHINMIPGWFAPPGAVHFENGWNYTSKPDSGWEYGIFLFLSHIVVYLVGSENYTLKHFMDNRQ